MTGSATYSFTKLAVQDLEAMAAYYCHVFGLEERQRVSAEIAGAPIDEIILGVDGAYGGLILLTWRGRTPPPPGEVILGFTTADIERLFGRAVGAGGSVRQHPGEVAAAPGFVVGFVADPEGHLAEVVQPRT
jgi:predicted enzyme related to lactoylglutathione lyase